MAIMAFHYSSICFACAIAILPVILAWGQDGHRITCMIAEPLLSSSARKYIKEFLPNGDFPSYCTWADEVRRTYKYRWSGPLHYIDTPDNLCNYDFQRDCHNEAGETGMCVSGAIQNYTSQLQSNLYLPKRYLYDTTRTRRNKSYNLTEALLFLVHFVGDIHQPLHVGFTSDAGGNGISVHWYTRKYNLHHVWDVNIIETAMDRNYNSDIKLMAEQIGGNFTKEDTLNWIGCGDDQLPCPDKYATESIEAACRWAYKDVEPNSILKDPYFYSRLPIVQQRLAQGGVRLAAILNKIF